ncbi:peptidoglycan-binding protein [Mycoplasmatota bacterium]|nr:peptidoglycan-binding protein [Mycoplasmatota bacterium]
MKEIIGGIIIDYYQYGNTGKEVKKIQSLLDKLDYELKVDGIYGKKTKDAVILYQVNKQLTIDGIVGPETLEHLLIDNGVKKDVAYINSRDFYSQTDYLIYSNLEKHLVSIFKGSNKSWELIKTYLATIGKPSTPTIKGIFTIKAKGPGYGGIKNGFKVKWYTQFYRNYLFHSILFNLNGTVFDDRLGMDLSDGCIRLKAEDAKYIYDKIPYGTLVIIQ